MKERLVEFYFPIVKLIYIFTLVIYFIIANENIDYSKSIIERAMLFIFIAVIEFYELLEKKRIGLLILSSIICAVLITRYQGWYSLLIPIVVLDFIAYCKLPIYFNLFTFLTVFQKDGFGLIYFISCIYCNTIYFQHYFIINRYKSILNRSVDNEESLKTSMENQKVRHKNDVKRFNLSFENKLLEEKSRLSQSLHDKIGHSINGSVYQLEACKLLIDGKPVDSKNIIQAVIDNLRKSSDEIRAILRKEKPNKGELALLQLSKLCEHFIDTYNINVKLVCSGESSDIPESIWEIILENSIEAFSNALKYSSCKTIKIEITVLNKMVRCSIKDDGRGCDIINQGMGLAGMKERINTIGGSIFFTSNIGFEINMLLPINQNKEIG